MKAIYQGFCLLVLGSLLLMPVSHAVESAAVGSCKVGCERALAQCEDKKGTKAHCPRKYQQCTDHCENPVKKDQRSKKQKRKVLCAQQCDLNRSTCEEANVGNTSACAAGQKTCLRRCD